ncbi:pseudouridine synthase [Roseibacillus ishigakijimensis]|uniref:Pseudouridine synthase n=1 Tax=Roseibacillus ishigakijimensis TaxID=454146 RepID=A0A934VMN9_9BACT|nr:pseudouridine synthase [Roseibacillus ishigakijimensis]MBK1834467.1 rRNA pseudouridine synthase [Roseibacillus ishigakijimensis]
MEEIRLNKFVASCTELSRREADRIIQEGEVSVNGSITINPAVRVTDEDTVRLGRKILSRRNILVVALHKPRGVVCSRSDERGRKTIYHLLPHKYHHLKHVGRLDLDSEGLLIMTNDGELAQKLTHPSKKLEKEYLVTVDQHFEPQVLLQLVKGVHIPEVGQAKAKFARRVSSRRLTIVLESGLKRQIRLMLETLGLRVTKLVRTRVGSLTMGELPSGATEELRKEDIAHLLTNPEPKAKPAGE